MLDHDIDHSWYGPYRSRGRDQSHEVQADVQGCHGPQLEPGRRGKGLHGVSLQRLFVGGLLSYFGPKGVRVPSKGGLKGSCKEGLGHTLV